MNIYLESARRIITQIEDQILSENVKEVNFHHGVVTGVTFGGNIKHIGFLMEGEKSYIIELILQSKLIKCCFTMTF